MIRVGRKINNNVPSFDNFKNIIVLMKSSKYYSLSPYSLIDENGCIMENIWQFSKVYEKVPEISQSYSRFDNTVIWKHNSEIHLDKNNNLTDEYWKWREKGYNNKYAVRYPVGFNYRKKCLYSYYDGEKLDYISSRKKIYLPIYKKLVKKQPQFLELVKLLKKGVNLLIIEVDGPHQESLQYYKDKYGVNDNFIENNTILINKENMNIMLNDSLHNFGHGYCLGMALMDELDLNLNDL